VIWIWSEICGIFEICEANDLEHSTRDVLAHSTLLAVLVSDIV